MYRYLVIFFLMTIITFLYERYKLKLETIDAVEHVDLVRRFLLNQTALKGGKPIVWVHIEYNTNARNWINFGSRNSNELNQPYKYITIQSIINQSNGDYHVCLIDDNSFGKLLTGWHIDIEKLADPLKSHMRSLALSKILYYYGGVLIPSNYLALRPLREIIEPGLNDRGCFIVETHNKNITSTYTNVFPNHLFMGCKKENACIKELMLYLEQLQSRDFTNEQDFLGQINRKCYEFTQENKLNCIGGQFVGVLDKENKPVLVEHLLETAYINFLPSMNGIFIPEKDILKRTKYAWFARMSPMQIYTSNIILCKYLLSSNI